MNFWRLQPSAARFLVRVLIVLPQAKVTEKKL